MSFLLRVNWTKQQVFEVSVTLLQKWNKLVSLFHWSSLGTAIQIMHMQEGCGEMVGTDLQEKTGSAMSRRVA